jgi:hypothetical protein
MSTDDITLAPNTPILEREPEALAPHMQSNSALVAKTLDRNTHGLLTRLFPDELDQVVRSHEAEQLQTGFEYRRRALRMAVESKLQAVEEMCNHVLVTGKSEIRRKRQEFFAEQKLELEGSMNACAERFQAQIEPRLGALSAIPNEHLREREEQRLLRAVDDFYDMLDQLGREFLDIIREGVSRG